MIEIASNFILGFTCQLQILLALGLLPPTFCIPCKYCGDIHKAAPVRSLSTLYMRQQSWEHTKKPSQLVLNEKSTSNAHSLSLRFLLFASWSESFIQQRQRDLESLLRTYLRVGNGGKGCRSGLGACLRHLGTCRVWDSFYSKIKLTQKSQKAAKGWIWKLGVTGADLGQTVRQYLAPSLRESGVYRKVSLAANTGTTGAVCSFTYQCDHSIRNSDGEALNIGKEKESCFQIHAETEEMAKLKASSKQLSYFQ